MLLSKISLMGYTLHRRECLVHFEYCPPIFVVNYFTLHFWKQNKKFWSPARPLDNKFIKTPYK